MADRLSRARTWPVVGLVVYGLAAAAILLAPVSYSGIINAIWTALRNSTGIHVGAGWIEFSANILLFVPLGFLLAVLLRRAWAGAILGLLVSVVVETVQFVIPHREPSLRDVISNTVGAAIGALLAWLIVLRLQRRQRRATQAVRSSR